MKPIKYFVISERGLAAVGFACRMDSNQSNPNMKSDREKELEAENKKLKAECNAWREKALAYKLLCQTFAADGR